MADQNPTGQQAGRVGLQEQFITVNSVYFNGFVLGLSNADLNALLLLDGQPIVKLNMSYTTSKTLLTHLKTIMDRFESATKHPIMTTNEVEEGLRVMATQNKND